ncbi:MAG: EAL domain-containing protein [Nostoc sp.]|uniref:sensor domain-containing protein n=1 Tax=Nostoc sp. TaxID=1180 RepID=UPI002FFA629C
MNIDNFSQQIQKLRSWVQELLQRTETEPNLQQELIIETFEPLQIAVEELLAVFEQLKVTTATAEKERQRYQELFDLAPDAYLITDTKGKIQEVNYTAATLFSVPQIYLIGKPLILFIVQQNRQTFISNLNNLQQLDDWEIYLKPRFGTPFPTSIKASPIFDSQEKPIGWRWLLRNISKRKQAEEQVAHLAFHDALTGLPNRALFMNRLRQAVDYSKRRSDYLFAVLFLDLDRFKLINDSLGHIFGDQVLLAVAQRLQECLRFIDIAARLGGDEFIVLLEEIKDVKQVVAVAERIQQKLAQIVVLDGQEVFITASIGIVLSMTGCKQPEDFLRNADIAMYRAKTQGRARYEIFNTEMHIQAMAHLQLVNDLRRAIDRQEFRIHYQPIMSLISGRIVGLEALVRWLHPELGIILPQQFMPTAQEAGLGIEIDMWVLREACRQTQQWQERFSRWKHLGERPLSISVNLCTLSFNQQNLLSQLNQVLQETGLSAQSLIIEITENVITENNEQAIIKLEQLRNLGIRLAIDDFGTGYSSLSRLQRFPINQLKSDRSFISTNSDDQGNLDIIEIIVTLSKKLAVDLTVEGVETAQQLAFLRAIKCEYAQGYFFSKPLDCNATEALIVANPRW